MIESLDLDQGLAIGINSDLLNYNSYNSFPLTMRSGLAGAEARTNG